MNADFINASINATLRALEGKVCDTDLENLLKSMPTNFCKVDSARAVQAEASLFRPVIFARISCKLEGKPYRFEAQERGPGLHESIAVGILYHSYENENAWDMFFREATSYHAQGIEEGRGIFQINWFRKDGVPIGQFNGVMVVPSIFELGGSGKWIYEGK